MCGAAPVISAVSALPQRCRAANDQNKKCAIGKRGSRCKKPNDFPIKERSRLRRNPGEGFHHEIHERRKLGKNFFRRAEPVPAAIEDRPSRSRRLFPLDPIPRSLLRLGSEMWERAGSRRRTSREQARSHKIRWIVPAENAPESASGIFIACVSW